MDSRSSKVAGVYGVRQYYGRKEVGQTYEHIRFSSFFGWATHAMEVEILNSLLEESQPHRLLEIAIGPGRLTRNLSFFDWAVGIDTAENMLNMAQRVLHQDTWSLVRADVSHMPFEKGCFDAVIAFRLLEHFEMQDRQSAYKEIGHVLKPGGLFISNVNNAYGFGRWTKKHILWVKHFLDYWSAKIIRTRILDGRRRAGIFSKLYTSDEIDTEMANNGFRIVSKRGVICNFCLQLPFYLLNYVEPVLPKRMGNKLRALASAPFFRLERSCRRGSKHSLGWIVAAQRGR